MNYETAMKTLIVESLHWTYSDMSRDDIEDVVQWLWEEARSIWKQGKGMSLVPYCVFIVRQRAPWHLSKWARDWRMESYSEAEREDSEDIGPSAASLDQRWNPERLCIFKEQIDNLSREAKILYHIAIQNPVQLMDKCGSSAPRNMRGALVRTAKERFGRHMGVWWDALRELSEVAKKMEV